MSNSAVKENDYGRNLAKLLNILFPKVVEGKQNWIELCPDGLEPIAAKRSGDMVSLFHYIDGEIHECPYVCISIDLKANTAHTVSYHLAEVQWYKNVNDYNGDGRIKIQTLLNKMTCEWLFGIIRRTQKRSRVKKIIKELIKK